jgi:hypothetical protein
MGDKMFYSFLKILPCWYTKNYQNKRIRILDSIKFKTQYKSVNEFLISYSMMQKITYFLCHWKLIQQQNIMQCNGWHSFHPNDQS